MFSENRKKMRRGMHVTVVSMNTENAKNKTNKFVNKFLTFSSLPCKER